MLICLLLLFQARLPAQSSRKVRNFDINGLRLNMDLDQVIKLYNINNINVKRDVYGIINGYEVKKRSRKQRIMILLSFTGEKRLYRIHFSTIYDDYRHRSRELFETLLKKYGKPWLENSESSQRKRNIFACWGSSCKKYPHTTPIMTAKINYASGRIELMLVDNRIFNRDWKLYKQKLAGQITDRNKATPETEENDALSK